MMSKQVTITREFLEPLDRDVIINIAVMLQRIVDSQDRCLTDAKLLQILTDQLVIEQRELIETMGGLIGGTSV